MALIALGSPLKMRSAPTLAPFEGHPFFTAQDVTANVIKTNRIVLANGVSITFKNKAVSSDCVTGTIL